MVPSQVAFGGDPEAALIQYTKNEEARKAISSTEAVLNNRFIRVYWHREPSSSTTPQQQEQTTGGPAATSAPSPAAQHSNVHMVGSTYVHRLFFSPSFLPEDLVYFFFNLQGIRQHNPAAYVLNKTGAKHRCPAGPANVPATNSDSLDSYAEPVAVRVTHLFKILQ